MAEGYKITYTAGARDMAEAMLVSGKALSRGGNAWLIAMLQVVTLLLCAIGGMSIALLIYRNASGGSDVLWPALFGGAIVGVFLSIFTQRAVVRVFGSRLAETRFMDGPQTMELSAEGVTMKNAHAAWRTDWTGVEVIAEGRNIIGIVASGIVQVVPRDMVGSDEAQAAFLVDLHTWHKAALDPSP